VPDLSDQPNLFEPEFDDEQKRPGFSFRRAQLGRRAGGERLGASLYEIEPDSATYPYHYHLGNEELLIVVRGRPHLRTPAGWRQLEEGDLVAFPASEEGTHQVANRTDQSVRVLIVSEMAAPDVVVYPDSGKVGARGRAPGDRREGLRMTFRSTDQVDYWESEQPPEVPS
jgi:uncharacterized cupin superfamily protein